MTYTAFVAKWMEGQIARPANEMHADLLAYRASVLEEAARVADEYARRAAYHSTRKDVAKVKASNHRAAKKIASHIRTLAQVRRGDMTRYDMKHEWKSGGVCLLGMVEHADGPYVKAADVEALERRVKWLEEGKHLVTLHLGFLDKRHTDQLGTLTQLGAIVQRQKDWLAREPTSKKERS